jgi:Uma2 family endonuclease
MLEEKIKMNTELVIQIPAINVQTIVRLQPLDDNKLSDKDFERFVRENPEMRIEQTKEGEIIIMPPTGGTTGFRNFEINGQFYEWHKKNKFGTAFDSSTIFVLPSGAKRSPDLSWIKAERWGKLTKTQQDKFPPICPDFVVELRSKTDSLKDLQNKMKEYVENGAQLGWLIDSANKKVHVYRQNQEVEILNAPNEISGGPLLPGFVLPLKGFWE